MKLGWTSNEKRQCVCAKQAKERTNINILCFRLFFLLPSPYDDKPQIFHSENVFIQLFFFTYERV